MASVYVMVCLLLRASITSQQSTDTSTCTPGGQSVFYPTTYEIREDLGILYGWDTSDPRYRFPHNNTIDGLHGGSFTAVYVHNLTGAILYLGGRFPVRYDALYLTCLNIRALVDMDAPLLYKPMQEKLPYMDDYPEYGERPAKMMPRGEIPALSQIRVPEEGWFEASFWSQIETFIDEQLTAGHASLIFDGTSGCGPGERELGYCEVGEKPASCGPDCTGCGGGAAVAIAYIMRKTGLPYQEVYDTIHAERPCIEMFLSMSEEHPPYRHFVTELHKIR